MLHLAQSLRCKDTSHECDDAVERRHHLVRDCGRQHLGDLVLVAGDAQLVEVGKVADRQHQAVLLVEHQPLDGYGKILYLSRVTSLVVGFETLVAYEQRLHDLAQGHLFSQSSFTLSIPADF